MPPEENAPEWLQNVPELLREAPFLKAAESPEDALAKIQHAASYIAIPATPPPPITNTLSRNCFLLIFGKAPPSISNGHNR